MDLTTYEVHPDLSFNASKNMVIPKDKTKDKSYNFYVKVTVPNRDKSVFTTLDIRDGDGDAYTLHVGCAQLIQDLQTD